MPRQPSPRAKLVCDRSNLSEQVKDFGVSKWVSFTRLFCSTTMRAPSITDPDLRISMPVALFSRIGHFLTTYFFSISHTLSMGKKRLFKSRGRRLPIGRPNVPWDSYPIQLPQTCRSGIVNSFYPIHPTPHTMKEDELHGVATIDAT